MQKNPLAKNACHAITDWLTFLRLSLSARWNFQANENNYICSAGKNKFKWNNSTGMKIKHFIDKTYSN